jgi:hypothetical protein
MKPCKACPWRRDSDAANIPFFSFEQAVQLRHTCNAGSRKIMACHESPMDRPTVCHGFAQSNESDVHIGLAGATMLGFAHGPQPRRSDCFGSYDEMANHHGWIEEEGEP